MLNICSCSSHMTLSCISVLRFVNMSVLHLSFVSVYAVFTWFIQWRFGDDESHNTNSSFVTFTLTCTFSLFTKKPKSVVQKKEIFSLSYHLISSRTRCTEGLGSRMVCVCHIFATDDVSTRLSAPCCCPPQLSTCLLSHHLSLTKEGKKRETSFTVCILKHLFFRWYKVHR